MTDHFVDFTNGNDAHNGLSFANRALTVGGITSGSQAVGDRIKLMKSLDPTQLSSNATWTNGATTMTLGAAICKVVDTCDSAWTAATNVTATTSSSNPKVGTGNTANLVIAGAFTTGKVAAHSFASTDFSAFQQVNFWIKSNGDVSASVFRLDLCSDTLGATPVNSFTITFAISSSNGWHAVVIDNGSALGAAIQSVALIALSDPGAITVNLEHIFVSKAPASADCLTLHTLIAKSSAPTGNDGWYGIAGVSGTGTTVTFDASRNSTSNPVAVVGYEGSTATVATYVRQCIPVTTTAAFMAPTKAGSDGSPIIISGGWDTSAMTTQNGETWISQVAEVSTIGLTAKSFLTYEKIGFAFFNVGISDGNATCVANTIDSCSFCNMATSALSTTAVGSGGWVITNCRAMNCSAPFNLSGLKAYPSLVKNCTAISTFTGNQFSGMQSTQFVNCTARNGAGYGFQFAAGVNGNIYNLQGCNTSLNATAGVQCTISQQNRLNAVNCTFSDSTKFAATANPQDTTIYSENDGNVAGAHLIKNFSYTIIGQTTTRHTASGIAWKISPTNTNLNSLAPVKLLIAEPYFAAGSLATVTVWVQRDSTSLNMVLIAPAIADRITSDASAATSVAINTWDQLTITFTPAVAGVIPIYVYAYGGTTLNGYVDDITVSQA